MAHAAEAHEDERVVRVRSQTVREAAEGEVTSGQEMGARRDSDRSAATLSRVLGTEISIEWVADFRVHPHVTHQPITFLSAIPNHPREPAEREAGLRAAGTTASFLESAQKGVYGAEGGLGASGNGSLAEAVNRRKHFNQRGSAAGGAAFRR